MQVWCPGNGVRALGATRCPVCGNRVYVKTNGVFGRHWTYPSSIERMRLVRAAAMYGEQIEG